MRADATKMAASTNAVAMEDALEKGERREGEETGESGKP